MRGTRRERQRVGERKEQQRKNQKTYVLPIGGRHRVEFAFQVHGEALKIHVEGGGEIVQGDGDGAVARVGHQAGSEKGVQEVVQAGEISGRLIPRSGHCPC